MFFNIILALCWFGLTGLVSIDYIERVRDKGEPWRAFVALPLLVILAPFIGLGGVAGEIMDAVIDDGGGEDDRGASI